MKDVGTVIELTASNWKQFVGAVLRRPHGEALLAMARPRGRRQRPADVPGNCCASLLWMLAVSAGGLWLLGG